MARYTKEEQKFYTREYRRQHPLETGANAEVSYRNRSPEKATEMQKRIDDAMKAELARERRELEESSAPEPEDD